MKLNPFRKKTGGYFAKLQADYAEVCAEIKATEAALAAARDDHAAKSEASRELEARHPQRLHTSSAEKTAQLAANAAGQRVRELERALWSVKERHSGLRQRVEAPQRLASAQAKLVELGEQGQLLRADLDKTHTLIAKIDARVTDLTAQINAETEAASASMIEADGAFVMPEALVRLDTELRVARVTLADLCDKAQRLDAELNALPDQWREARRTFRHARAAVAELELQEQLPGFIELIARAAVSRHECDRSRPAYCYEVEIPHELVSAVQTRLDAEVPAN